jgi:hypothetical protein
MIGTDEIVLDWFAGAIAMYDAADTIGIDHPWDHAEACLAFSDIGDFGADPRCQIVMHAKPDLPGPAIAISLEVDRQDAATLIALLSGWLAKAGIPSQNE